MTWLRKVKKINEESKKLTSVKRLLGFVIGVLRLKYRCSMLEAIDKLKYTSVNLQRGRSAQVVKNEGKQGL